MARTINVFFFCFLFSDTFENDFFFCFCFPDTFLPLEKGLNTAFLGPTFFFFRPFMHAGCCVQKKNNNTDFNSKKHQRFPNNYRLGHRTRLRVRVIITDFTYGTEKVYE